MQAASALAFYVGVLSLGLGVLHFGIIVDFMPHSVPAGSVEPFSALWIRVVPGIVFGTDSVPSGADILFSQCEAAPGLSTRRRGHVGLLLRGGSDDRHVAAEGSPGRSLVVVSRSCRINRRGRGSRR